MKPKFILLALVAFTIAAVVSAMVVNRRSLHSSGPAGTKSFAVRGEIRAIDLASATVRIAHEEIPGYMPAMTMPFTVRKTALLAGLAPGDAVAFELTVTEEDSWISAIDKIPGGKAAGNEISSQAQSDRESERLQSGEAVPDFALIDQNGRAVRLGDFRGKAVVLTFIYTRCPIPNFCPLMSKNFQALQERLSREFPGRYHLLSVSIDPRFDQPEVLKEYGARYGADETQWTLATGTEEQIDFVAKLMGLFHEPENGLISHDLRTALIGPDGRLVHLWKSNLWTPYEVQRMISESLNTTREGLAAR